MKTVAFLGGARKCCYDRAFPMMITRTTPDSSDAEAAAPAVAAAPAAVAGVAVASAEAAAVVGAATGEAVESASVAVSPSAGAGPRVFPARKPMARATRIALFEREVRERLSRAALDVIFARADRLSEGQRQPRGGRETFFGSTMLTVDLAAFADIFRDACDAGTARRLAALMESDATVPRRIREIAEREAARIAAVRLKDLRTQIVVRAQGAKVFIDVDVEGALA